MLIYTLLVYLHQFVIEIKKIKTILLKVNLCVYIKYVKKILKALMYKTNIILLSIPDVFNLRPISYIPSLQ